MLLNKNLMKAAIARAGYTQGKLAAEIGISENTLSAKMTGISCFDTDQIDKICDVLGITENEEKANIFLSSPSHIWESTKINQSDTDPS